MIICKNKKIQRKEFYIESLGKNNLNELKFKHLYIRNKKVVDRNYLGYYYDLIKIKSVYFFERKLLEKDDLEYIMTSTESLSKMVEIINYLEFSIFYIVKLNDDFFSIFNSHSDFCKNIKYSLRYLYKKLEKTLKKRYVNDFIFKNKFYIILSQIIIRTIELFDAKIDQNMESLVEFVNVLEKNFLKCNSDFHKKLKGLKLDELYIEFEQTK